MRILLIKLSSIGDLVHSIPSYKALQKNLSKEYPDLKIDWLVYKNLAPVLFKSIDQKNLITLENKKLTSLITKASELKNQYDLVIDLQGLFKTALISKIICPSANYGFKEPRESWARYFYKDAFCDYKSIESKKHVIDQNLELVTNTFQKLTDKDFEVSIDFGLETQALSKDKQSLCIIPATTWESKHWDFENWVNLINSFTDDFNFFITGSPADQEYLSKIKEACSKEINLVTDKKLEELYDFYKDMDIVIGVDTGPLHIAAASLYKNKDQKKVIGIYGPSSGSRSGPYGFTAVSADEIFNIKASNKRTYQKDNNSINRISSDLILKELEV